jgi:NAD(P)H-dependent flavin oxidoreductase YrpB (nitropropane dioxygenase family)
MGGVCTPQFVAAAAQAGALGVMPIWMLLLEVARAAIAQIRALNVRPVAVNLRADWDQDALIAAAAEGGVDEVLSGP